MAQLLPDRSLGNHNSLVTPKDNLVGLIQGGTVRNNNLFHSFEQFNVATGEKVYFANPSGITNILTRVTGKTSSQILGTLGVEGAANLFLLNPNGIVFGKNAALDVNGSFFATTAESFVFGNGLEFSATQPETAPLLTVNFTPGLQMGSNSGSITVQDEGHLITGDLFSPLTNLGTVEGLDIESGQTLGLIASEINLEGGILRASGGDIHLVSIKAGKLWLDNDGHTWQLDSSGVQSFGDINLVDRALVSSSGFFTGNLNLQGRNISLQGGSAVGIQNVGTQPTGKITVTATDSIVVTDLIQYGSNLEQNSQIFPALILSENLGTGGGGDIDVSGKNLFIANGSAIFSRSFSDADTGNINVDIDGSIEIKAYSKLDFSIPSLIGTTAFSNSNAGEVNVSARKITISDGATIASSNFGSGKGGTVKVDVTEDLNISGFNPYLISPSAVGSTSYRTGNSGNLTINTARLSIMGGAAINTTTLAKGNAGQLTVNATESIKVSGEVPELGLKSAIGSNAVILQPIFRQTLGLPALPSGNSGDMILNTPNLTANNGGFISASNYGTGNSGSLQINSERVFLDDRSNITGFSASGQGGNLKLNIEDSLLLRNGSSISAQAQGAFVDNNSNINGGKIDINANTITLLENSQINASAFQGNGGDINILTEGLFVSLNSQITASSEFGLDGNIEIKRINSDRTIELEPLSLAIIDVSQQITQSCNADTNNFTVVGNGGLPENPAQQLRGRTVWRDTRLSVDQRQSNLQDNQPLTRSDRQNLITEFTRWTVNARGNLELLAVNHESWQQSPHCQTNFSAQ